MSGRNRSTVAGALALASAVAASPVGGAAAGDMPPAREAIVLEILGAVRMAQPDETRRMATERESVRARSKEPPRRERWQASAR